MISSLVVLYFTLNSNVFFNDSEIHLLLQKNHLEKSRFFDRSRGRFNLIDAATCLTSAVVLTKKNRLLIYADLSTASARTFSVAPLFVFLFKKKMFVAPVPLTILTKPIVRLRCRCSCEMCRTSAVPLLVILETALKSS